MKLPSSIILWSKTQRHRASRKQLKKTGNSAGWAKVHMTGHHLKATREAAWAVPAFAHKHESNPRWPGEIRTCTDVRGWNQWCTARVQPHFSRGIVEKWKKPKSYIWWGLDMLIWGGQKGTEVWDGCLCFPKGAPIFMRFVLQAARLSPSPPPTLSHRWSVNQVWRAAPSLNYLIGVWKIRGREAEGMSGQRATRLLKAGCNQNIAY